MCSFGRVISIGPLFTAIILLSWGFSNNRPARASETLAVIEGEGITTETFAKEMERRSLSEPLEKEALLEEMIRFEVQAAAARKAGYAKDPEIHAALKKLMVAKLRKELLEPRLTGLSIPDREIEDYYREHQLEFGTPRRVRMALIEVRTPPKASGEKRAQLVERARAARAEALKLSPEVSSLGGVAARYSDDQASRYRGGEVGWVDFDAIPDRWGRELQEAVSALPNSPALTPVVETPNGFLIAKVMEAKERSLLPLDVVRERIRHKLLNDRKATIEKEFIEELKARVQIQAGTVALGSIEPPSKSREKAFPPRPPDVPGR